LTFDPRDTADMVRKIENLLADSALRIQLGEKAARRAREFTLARTAASTAEVLRAAAGRRGRNRGEP